MEQPPGYEIFDAKGYLDTRFPTPGGECQGAPATWYVQCYHEFYQKFHSEWDANKARLLEFGGGPTLHSLFSAPPYVQEIIFTEYADANREQVLLWKNKDPKAHDWSPFLKHVLNTLEGVTDPQAIIQREEDLREKITAIEPCNALTTDCMIDPKYTAQPFDIITSNLTCDVVCTSIDHYVETLKKFGSWLNPKGFLTCITCEETTWYMVGGFKYKTLYLTEQDTHDSFKKAGFAIRYSKRVTIPREVWGRNNDMKATNFIVGQKL